MSKVTQPLCGRSETSLCPLACAPTLGCSSELPGTVLEVQTPWSPLRIRIIPESRGLCKRDRDRSPSDSKAVLRSEAGNSCSTPQRQGKVSEERGQGSLSSGGGLELSGCPKEALPPLLHSMSGPWGLAFPADPGPEIFREQKAGRRGIRLPWPCPWPSFLFPPLLFSELSPSLARGNGVGWGWPTELISSA